MLKEVRWRRGDYDDKGGVDNNEGEDHDYCGVSDKGKKVVMMVEEEEEEKKMEVIEDEKVKI